MLTRWTQHLKDPKEKQAFTNDILSARSVLERLIELVEEDERSLDRSETNPSAYLTPNWDYHQAHKNGVRQYINSMKTMLNLDQQKEK